MEPFNLKPGKLYFSYKDGTKVELDGVCELKIPTIKSKIKPKETRDKERIHELSEVILNYLDSSTPFPEEWREELVDLLFEYSDYLVDRRQ